MTWAGTGVNQPPTQSLRERQYSAEMQAKPKQQTEQDRITDIYLVAHNARVAADKALLEQEIKSGRVVYK